MCGIAGFSLFQRLPSAPHHLQAMAQGLQHRGPDDQGVAWCGAGIGLAHTRLSIIDLAGGHQPFIDPSGITVIANGEIYNHQALRQALERPVPARSDCAVVGPLYETYGINFTHKLQGMYALAIADPAQEKLILARDPFGIKPLYYAQTKKGLVFASECQAILASGLVPKALNEWGRNQLLAYNFTLGRTTLFQGIERVLPGETIVVEKGKITQRLQHPFNHFSPSTLRAQEALSAFEKIMAQSVADHRLGDVPMGLFFSGGIDSTILLAHLGRDLPQNFPLYTLGFDDARARDERNLAHKLAQLYPQARHRQVGFSAQDFWTVLPQVAQALDDPTSDYACLPTYKLARVAAEDGVKVIFSGEGGDELFAGYGRYKKARRPRWLGGNNGYRQPGFQKVDVIDLPFKELAADYQAQAAAIDGWENLSKLQQAQAIDGANWLPNDLLTKLDRCLMAHGLEGRPPFLDQQVAQFAFSLPDKLKIRQGKGKWLLRKWLAEQPQLAPIAQPFGKKRGFTVPVGEWLYDRRVELAQRLSSAPCLQALSSPKRLQTFFQNLDKSNKYQVQAAWSLVFYRAWHEAHF